jgi:hypothetical protein
MDQSIGVSDSFSSFPKYPSGTVGHALAVAVPALIVAAWLF